jgi:DNA-binding NtrC family response regulator
VVATAEDGRRALDLLGQSVFDLLLTDQRMPGMDGLELLERARQIAPSMPVVVMTAHGSVGDAVTAMKLGAIDYLTKPFDRDELLLVIEKALRHRRLEHEVAALRAAMRVEHRLGGMIGSSPPMQELFDLLQRVGPTAAPVLIVGESGTGKELVARAVHAGSARASGPFVALNCAAVPDQLLESEFFGFERGAFTGATHAHPGRFEQADGGTLFLDEIGAMRVDLQAKLLRVIQEGEVQRLGSTASRRVDVRIIAATCEDLEVAIRERRFRDDLYYRLSVVPVSLAPLRERSGDVGLLVGHFLTASAAKLGRPAPGLAPGVIERLEGYSWPGNVRQLQNTIERMVILARGDRLTVDDLPTSLRRDETAPQGGGPFTLPAEGVPLDEVERSLIVQALQRSRGSLGPAARLLGMSYKTLQYRLKKFGIDRETFEADAAGDRG